MPNVNLRDFDRPAYEWQVSTTDHEPSPYIPKSNKRAWNELNTPSMEILTGSIHSPYKLIQCENLSEEDIQRLIKYQNVLVDLMTASQSTGDISTKLSSVSEPSEHSPTEEAAESIDDLSLRTSSTDDVKMSLESKINGTSLEILREYIRMDKSLPLLRNEEIKLQTKKSREKPPRITPKTNRTQLLRHALVQRDSYKPFFNKDLNIEWKEGTRKSTLVHPSEERKYSMSYLKKIAEKYLKAKKTNVKFNRLFQLRYRHNQGNPRMPISLEEFYWNYKKLPFKVVRKMHLPKRYLQPSIPDQAISYWGLTFDYSDPYSHQFQYKKLNKSDEEEEEKPAREKARPPIKKTKHELRLTRSSIRTGKRPWNYGTYKRLYKIAIQ